MRKGVLVFFFAFCCVTRFAYAGDTASLPVSCTIPAIPGVNTPLLEQEQVQLSPETEELIQQDAPTAAISVSSPQVLVKTYYAR
jgi:hypothetical protein